jgi:type IV secretory pathway VirB2 component (pilin)
MDTVILRSLFVICGGPLACAVATIGVVYLAWMMSRPDNGWDR